LAEEQRHAEAARLEEERIRRKEEMSRDRRIEEDRIHEIRNKCLKVGQPVTVVGFSHVPGDTVLTSNSETGQLRLGRVGHPMESLILQDLRRLTVYDRSEEESEFMALLCLSTDKYEAAVSLYHCICHDGICHCRKVVSARASLTPEYDRPALGDSLHVGVGYASGNFARPRMKSSEVTGQQKIQITYDDGRSYHVGRD
jgi:hypothetical protein